MQIPSLNENIIAKARQIKLVICDVDGVLTDGKIVYDETGQELKFFYVQDGLGLQWLRNNNIEVALISSRKSNIVEKRAKELGIIYLYQGITHKMTALQELLNILRISTERVAHIGDDLPDLTIMKNIGLGIAVANADEFVKQHATFITQNPGGQGAVREVAELILAAQNKLLSIKESYL